CPDPSDFGSIPTWPDDFVDQDPHWAHPETEPRDDARWRVRPTVAVLVLRIARWGKLWPDPPVEIAPATAAHGLSIAHRSFRNNGSGRRDSQTRSASDREY